MIRFNHGVTLLFFPFRGSFADKLKKNRLTKGLSNVPRRLPKFDEVNPQGFDSLFGEFLNNRQHQSGSRLYRLE